MDPPNAAINKMAISGELFNVKIINKEKQDIKVIPEERPSNPSIKLIALVIPIIQQIVIIYEKQSLSQILSSKKGKLMFSIRIPHATTIVAASICIISFTMLGIPLESSIKQVIPNTTIPIKNPRSLSQYCSFPNKSTECSKFITISK